MTADPHSHLPKPEPYQRLGSGDGERKTLLTRQIAFEPLPASVLFAPLCVCPAWARCKWGSSPLWKYQIMRMKKPPSEANSGRVTNPGKEG